VTKKAIKLGLMGEDLDQWFDEEWVDISETDEDGNHPPCGEMSDTEKRENDPENNYPKCVPRSKAKDMTEKEKEELVKKKQQSVNQDDADQSSEDGSSDEPTYTSSDPDEHFSKRNKTTMNESALRKFVREEIQKTLKEQGEPNERFLEMVEELKFDLDQLSVSTETREQKQIVEEMQNLLRRLKNTSDYTYVRRTGEVKPQR
jgi:hypothetical protein